MAGAVWTKLQGIPFSFAGARKTIVQDVEQSAHALYAANYGRFVGDCATVGESLGRARRRADLGGPNDVVILPRAKLRKAIPRLRQTATAAVANGPSLTNGPHRPFGRDF